MRIAGANIPDNKNLEIALSYLYGVGVSSAQKILDQINIPRNKKVKDLTPAEVILLRETVEKRVVEGELRRQVMMNIKRLRDIKCYRGSRHSKGLPARGQRTKTNSRTRRGNVRRTAISGRRKLEKT
ncbi:MAG: 30S ribosomal protein S13 [Candidatus Tagabacteria bacterium CG_4_10_14_0_2_um_filter_40_13]|uniref:Small ribosomal subunit protein uS13 n=3 Tax=Candidatus Tagaibacteriota TaxID=1817918 RepID=A0A2M8G908_9BACT|nr:MAG: 30S ribosomal protein S13 [Candidatus Tagabacteria bacterium CG11_big_fil_rev_8_21_14_0_20_41_11]PIU99855.1 MAG: 30S ribosomal protein S13 [Candidatus Tagabacteria bacterium CG03_land_8_20_14_0_80_41_22]PIZ56641.1 MAG: 30S ribosomal protein S13 [Candidatus Tagabacteria bacterium CG_4_10_14_0_2_um_filter_40_13]PJC25391.1 MAG: 30S ribosomal protein S13 [Candidatus Tagabacteria bacterium CG_4_9_14_0_2_um_filter_41_11]PJC69922.1 MAG: 30S ribosomal protein S13 [Candidatus Tagabacteria bacter